MHTGDRSVTTQTELLAFLRANPGWHRARDVVWFFDADETQVSHKLNKLRRYGDVEREYRVVDGRSNAFWRAV